MQQLSVAFLHSILLGVASGAFRSLLLGVFCFFGFFSYRKTFVTAWLLRLPFVEEKAAKQTDLRFCKRKRAVGIALADILFSLTFACAFRIFLFAENDGIFRFIFLIGTFLGYLCWRKTLHLLFFLALDLLLPFLKTVFCVFVWLLAFPLSLFLRCIILLLYFVFSKTLLIFNALYVKINRKRICESRLEKATGDILRALGASA